MHARRVLAGPDPSRRGDAVPLDAGAVDHHRAAIGDAGAPGDGLGGGGGILASSQVASRLNSEMSASSQDVPQGGEAF
jgi:hypothetical protein